MMKKDIIIGVDLGGTKILTGAINYKGVVLGTPVKVLTGGNDPGDEIIKRITDSIEKTINDTGLSINNITGIGIGSTGPLDIDSGVILECPQLPTLNFFPLRKTIQDFFGVPVLLNNDANCLILGECIFGAAVNKNNVVGFTLGTGLGCAIVLNGKILNGSTGTAAEIWPSPYQSGTIEDFLSGAGVSRIYKSISAKDKTSLDIYNLAIKGDIQALQTWEEFGAHLAIPVAWSINLIDPEIVIIGGSISAAYEFFKNSLEKNYKKWVCPVPAEKTKVVVAESGDYAGFKGAACLVIKNK